MKSQRRFTGLVLSEADLVELAARKAAGQKMTARTWRRIRVLELLSEGLSVRATAKAVGSYPREISRVGKRYLAGGIEAALTDEPRGRVERLLDSQQEAAIVALVCGPAPDGRARWTVRLLAKEVVRRGIAEKVGRECVRVVLARHALKPWREKNVVCAGNRRRVRPAHGGCA